MDHEDNGYLPMDPDLPQDVSTGTATSSNIISAKTVLLGMTIVSIIFFLIFFGYTAVWNGLRRRRQANWRQPQLTFSNRPEPSPRRLDQSAIDMIPVVELSLHGGETTELCAVCISEFIDGDKVRVLPQCSHRFHLECIDMWLNSHSTCPLCRSDVTATAKSDVLEPDETPITEFYSVYSEQRIINCPTEETQRTLRVNNCYDQNSAVHQSPLDHIV